MSAKHGLGKAGHRSAGVYESVRGSHVAHLLDRTKSLVFHSIHEVVVVKYNGCPWIGPDATQLFLLTIIGRPQHSVRDR